jgi:hypothetical protein
LGRPLIAAAAIAALALGGAACGDDETAETSTGATTQAATERTATERTSSTRTAASERAETEVETRTSDTGPVGERDTGGTDVAPAPSAEDEPGGAGDEEPALSLAQLTGRDGRITPSLVRVAPYIAIRVELRSGDGKPYALRIGDRTLRAGGELASASARFPGLQPDAALRGLPVGGAGTPVRIEATAQPGP